MAPAPLILCDLEMSESRSLRLQSLISRKGAQLGHSLPTHINGKSYIRSPMTPSHLTLSDPEGQSERHSDFEVLYSSIIKELR